MLNANADIESSPDPFDDQTPTAPAQDPEIAKSPDPFANTSAAKPVKQNKADVLRRISKEEGIDDPSPVLSIGNQELGSSMKPTVSGAGAVGGMQVLPATGLRYVTPQEWSTDEGKMRAGVRYYKDLLKQFNGNEQQAIAGYFTGQGNVNKAIKSGANLPNTLDPIANLRTPQYVNQVQQKIDKNTPDEIKSSPDPFGDVSDDIKNAPDPFAAAAPAVNAGAPGRPMTTEALKAAEPWRQDSFDTRKYLPKDKPVKSVAAPNPNAALIDSLNNQNPLATGHEVSSITNQPTQSLVERVGGQAKFDASNAQHAQQRAMRDAAYQKALNAPADQKDAAINEFAKLGPIEEGEQQALGITPHYLQNLRSFFARPEEIASGVARGAAALGIPGAKAVQDYTGRIAAEDRLAIARSGVRGPTGDIATAVGEIAPDILISKGIPAGAASELYWPAIGAAGAAGRGGNTEDIVKAGLGNIAPIAGAHLFAGAPLLGRIASNVALNETIAGMSGGAKDTQGILTTGILAGAMGWHGKPGTVEELQAQTTPEDIARAEKVGNDTNVVRAAREFTTTKSPESEAALRQAMVNAGMPVDQATAVINDTKSASAGAQENLQNTQESTTTPERLGNVTGSGRAKLNALGFADEQIGKMSGEEAAGHLGYGPVPEGAQKPIVRDEQGLPTRKIAPIPEHPIGETLPVESPARVTPDEDLQKPAPVVAPIDEQNQGQTASVKAFITKADEASLKSRGYSDDDIYKMKPADAQKILESPEVKPNATTESNPAATSQPNFDHEVKTVSDALNDDDHPFSRAIDNIVAGDTSDEAIAAARAAGKDFDPATIDDAIDAATRVARKQPTESPEPRTGETPAAESRVEQPGQTVEPPKPPEFDRTARPPSEEAPKGTEDRHWNFRRSQFSSAESEANFRDLIKKTVAENGEAHKTRVTQKEFVARANEIDPELAKEAIKNYKPGDPVPSREIFHAAAEYAQNNIREAGETRQYLKDMAEQLTQAQKDRLESHAERLEHDAKEAIGGAIGVRSEFGRNLALLATTKMDVDSPANMIRRADAAAKARGDDLTGKDWQIQRKQIMDQAVRLEQAKMREADLLKQLSESPKGKAKRTTEDVSLSTFVRKRGGFKSDKDLQGEINRLRSKESGTTGLFGKKGLSPDDMREAAVESGYLPEDATISDLMEKVEQDIGGKKVYSTLRDQGLYDKELGQQYKKANPEEFKTWQQRFTGKLDKLEQEARARLSESLNPNTHHDITDLPRMAADLAIILASKLAKGAISLTEVRKEMEDEFGEHFTRDQDRIEKAALEIHNDQRLEALTEAAKVPNKEVRKSALAELKGEVSKREQVAKTEQAKADKAVKDSQATEAKAAAKQAKLDEAAKQKQAAIDAREEAKKARQAQREAEVNEQKGIRQEAVNAKKAAAQEANPVYQLGVEAKATELRLNQPGEVATVDDLSKIGAAKLHEPGMTPSRWTAEMQKFGKSFTENQREIRDGAAKLSADAKEQVKTQQQSRTAAASDAYRAAIKQGKAEPEARAAAREARANTGALTDDQIAKLKDDYNQARTERMAAQRALAKNFANLEEGKLDKASTAIKAGLISSARTLGKIALSHSSFMGLEVARKIPSAITDMALSKITGNDRQAGGVSITELADAARKAVTRGLPDAYQKLKTGYFPEGEDIYSRVQGSSNPLETREFHSNSRVLNAWVNGIMRTHSAVYSIHRVMGAAMALREQANLAARVEVRKAVESGKIQPGEARAYQKMRSDQLFNNPSETMTAHAIEAAEEMAFVNESMASKAVSGVKGGVVKILGGSKLAKFAVDRVLPFTKVPANVAARTAEYAAGSAVAPIRAIYDRISHGEFTPEDQARFVKTFGRGTVGAGIMALGALAASKGYATGYVQGYDDKATVKIGGRSYHTGLIPPLGTLFALGATMYELTHFPVNTNTPAGKKAFGNAVIGSALKAGEEQPMLGELTKLSDLVESEDKKKALTKFLGGIAGQVVPTLVSDTAAQIDRTKRQKETVKDYVQERIPGARNYLKPSPFPGREPNKLFDPFASIPTNPANQSPDIRLREFMPKHK